MVVVLPNTTHFDSVSTQAIKQKTKVHTVPDKKVYHKQKRRKESMVVAKLQNYYQTLGDLLGKK